MISSELFEIDGSCVRREEMTVERLYYMMTTALSRLNPNPVGQRAPTNDGFQNSKNEGIIESILCGYGVDTIYIRDITVYQSEHSIRKLYNNDGYLTIDGGHRCRALRWFIENKFYITIDGNKFFFRDLPRDILEKFMQATVALKYIVCTSTQAHKWFLMINKMTQTNQIESIMADDESDVTRFIRTMTWHVPEYRNSEQIHPIFRVYSSNKSDYTTDIWSKANLRGSFYYHAFITLAKAIGNGNVDAGETAWKTIVADDYAGKPITKNAIEIWNKFFDDLLKFQKIVPSKKGLDDDSFGFFSCFWFHLQNKYGKNFRLDMDTLAPLLNRSKTLLTAKNGTRNNDYDDTIVKDVDGESEYLKPLMRSYVKAFAYGNKQAFAGEYILSEVERQADNDTGIIVMDTKRSLSLKDKEALFAAQMGKCWLDYNGHPCKSSDKKLTIDSCVLAHDTPYAYGGKASDGVIMCNPCHSKQGMFTLNEYVTHLNSENA
jgi:hypothetical protein